MAKSNGSTRNSASGSPRGISTGSSSKQPLTTGYYELDGKTIHVIANSEFDQYKSWSKQDVRQEAIRMNRGIYADEPGRTKSDYIADIVSAKFGRNVVTENELTKEQKQRMTRKR